MCCFPVPGLCVDGQHQSSDAAETGGDFGNDDALDGFVSLPCHAVCNELKWGFLTAHPEASDCKTQKCLGLPPEL